MTIIFLNKSPPHHSLIFHATHSNKFFDFFFLSLFVVFITKRNWRSSSWKQCCSLWKWMARENEFDINNNNNNVDVLIVEWSAEWVKYIIFAIFVVWVKKHWLWALWDDHGNLKRNYFMINRKLFLSRTVRFFNFSNLS